MNKSNEEHWNYIYTHKLPNEVSWTQQKPEPSMQLIRNLNLPKSAAIIDIGGGDSKLVDALLEDGFENITVLDISAQALERAQKRLGKKSSAVAWIVSDILSFKPHQQYDLWHDRAAFHFLTGDSEIDQYTNLVNQWATGYLVIGTFSDKGPDKCSGLTIKKYSPSALEQQFSGNGFELVQCFIEDHTTPFNTVQHFTFCSFKRVEK